jgi:hypothetical protein
MTIAGTELVMIGLDGSRNDSNFASIFPEHFSLISLPVCFGAIFLPV